MHLTAKRLHESVSAIDRSLTDRISHIVQGASSLIAKCTSHIVLLTLYVSHCKSHIAILHIVLLTLYFSHVVLLTCGTSHMWYFSSCAGGWDRERERACCQ